jgi:hypothetical protein
VIVVDSVTLLDPSARGRVVVTGSHGGGYPGRVVAGVGARAAVFNDAGVGRERAGIAALDELDSLGVPAVAVGHDTARIGDGDDTLRRGVVRHANPAARALGCVPPLACAAAAALLARGPHPPRPPEPPPRTVTPATEARRLLVARPPQVWALDSAALAGPADAGRVLVTGSHGGLLGGNPATALKADAAAAVFNDAGGGIDGAGLTRLPALDRRGIPAVTVAAASARIGDGSSSYSDGVVSAANRAAVALGAAAGMPARAFVALVTRAAAR